MNKKNVHLVVVIVIIIILAFFIVNVEVIFGEITGAAVTEVKGCPESVQGNNESVLKIKYFHSPYCVWCWLEEPILKKLIKEKGNLFSIEKYDIRFCSEAKKYGFTKTPSFVFIFNNTEEFLYQGFADESYLTNLICEVSEGC